MVTPASPSSLPCSDCPSSVTRSAPFVASPPVPASPLLTHALPEGRHPSCGHQHSLCHSQTFISSLTFPQRPAPTTLVPGVHKANAFTPPPYSSWSPTWWPHRPRHPRPFLHYLTHIRTLQPKSHANVCQVYLLRVSESTFSHHQFSLTRLRMRSPTHPLLGHQSPF